MGQLANNTKCSLKPQEAATAKFRNNDSTQNIVSA